MGGGGWTKCTEGKVFIISSKIVQCNSECTFLLKETRLSPNITLKFGNKI